MNAVNDCDTPITPVVLMLDQLIQLTQSRAHNCQVYDMAATTGRKGTHMVQNVCVVISATTREEN